MNSQRDPERLASPGPLRVSPDGRYLVDRDGQPFFWLGDTAWLLPQKARREDVALYLETRARQGFSVIQVAVVMAEERVTGSRVAGELSFRERSGHGAVARPVVRRGEGDRQHSEPRHGVVLDPGGLGRRPPAARGL